MSCPELALTEEAERDIRSIPRFTRATWGENQRNQYAQQLADAMGQLTRFSDLGQRRDQLSPGLRARRIGQHVIYDRTTSEVIRVLRVLHVRMDAAEQLAP